MPSELDNTGIPRTEKWSTLNRMLRSTAYFVGWKSAEAGNPLDSWAFAEEGPWHQTVYEMARLDYILFRSQGRRMEWNVCGRLPLAIVRFYAENGIPAAAFWLGIRRMEKAGRHVPRHIKVKYLEPEG